MSARNDAKIFFGFSVVPNSLARSLNFCVPSERLQKKTNENLCLKLDYHTYCHNHPVKKLIENIPRAK